MCWCVWIYLLRYRSISSNHGYANFVLVFQVTNQSEKKLREHLKTTRTAAIMDNDSVNREYIAEKWDDM